MLCRLCLICGPVLTDKPNQEEPMTSFAADMTGPSHEEQTPVTSLEADPDPREPLSSSQPNPEIHQVT